MQINVSQLLQEPIGAMRDYQVDEAADIIGDGNKYETRGECHLLHTQRSVLVKCALNTEVELTCNRCLRSTYAVGGTTRFPSTGYRVYS